MPWARASSLERMMACPAASWLPRWDGTGAIESAYIQPERKSELLVPDLLTARDRSAADRGTRAHELKELGLCYREWYEEQDPDGIHEPSFSYDCATGAVECFTSPDRADRDAWKISRGPACVTGTADWIGGNGDWVDDLKTGYLPPSVVTVATTFYAMCLYDTWRWTTPCPSIRVTMTHDPRGAVAFPAKKPRATTKPPRAARHEDTVTALDIEAFRSDLQLAWRRTLLGGAVKPGGHCNWCPSAAWCPSTRAI